MSAWEDARLRGSKAFFERATMTIRKYPENYCLAHRGKNGWQAYRDEGATRPLHDRIDALLREYQGGSTGDALAAMLGDLFT